MVHKVHLIVSSKMFVHFHQLFAVICNKQYSAFFSNKFIRKAKCRIQVQ